MKILTRPKLSVLAAILLIPGTAMLAKAQHTNNVLISQRAIREVEKIEGDKAPSIANAGVLNADRDHYFDVLVSGEPINRLEVSCVTFHELENVKVVDLKTNQEIPHVVNYGFEEFAVTFDEPIPVGQEVRIIMEESNVRGVTTGIIVPYRVFGQSDALGTIPLGTALVRSPSEN